MAKKRAQRRSFTLQQKLEAIRKVEAGESTGSAMAKAMGVQPAQFYKWKKQLGSMESIRKELGLPKVPEWKVDPEFKSVQMPAGEPEHVTPEYHINFCPNCGADQKMLKEVKMNWCYQCGACLHKIDLY